MPFRGCNVERATESAVASSICLFIAIESELFKIEQREFSGLDMSHFVLDAEEVFD